MTSGSNLLISQGSFEALRSGSLNNNNLKTTKASNRWSGLWGSSVKDSKMAALVQQLDTYSKIGIPKLHHQAHFEYEDEVEEGNILCLDILKTRRYNIFYY